MIDYVIEVETENDLVNEVEEKLLGEVRIGKPFDVGFGVQMFRVTDRELEDQHIDSFVSRNRDGWPIFFPQNVTYARHLDVGRIISIDKENREVQIKWHDR